MVVSALCFVGQFFGFVVAVPRTKPSLPPCNQQPDIILDLRNMADTVYKLHRDEMLTGPTGRTYCVTKKICSYPPDLCFPSPVQFGLPAKASLRFWEKCPDPRPEFLRHFHDVSGRSQGKTRGLYNRP